METKRRYTLSEAGRASLQNAVQKNRPWEKSTGPTTEEGKQRSSKNGLVRWERIARAKEKNRHINPRGKTPQQIEARKFSEERRAYIKEQKAKGL